MQEEKQVREKKQKQKKTKEEVPKKSDSPEMRMKISTPKMRDIEVSARADTIEETKDCMLFLLSKVKEVENWVTYIDKDVKPKFMFFDEKDDK